MTDIMTPTLGESVTEATVARWTKKAGDAVKRDEVLVELETDKVEPGSRRARGRSARRDRRRRWRDGQARRSCWAASRRRRPGERPPRPQLQPAPAPEPPARACRRRPRRLSRPPPTCRWRPRSSGSSGEPPRRRDRRYRQGRPPDQGRRPCRCRPPFGAAPRARRRRPPPRRRSARVDPRARSGSG